MANSSCCGHVHGFRHLELDGADGDYDLGFKFEKKESDKSYSDPKTGVEVWAEPLLILYVSVAHRTLPRSFPTLRYGLTRSKFAGGLAPSSQDEQRLLEMACFRLRTDLAAVTTGDTTEAACDIEEL